MATTITTPGRGSRPRRSIRSRGSGNSGTLRDHRSRGSSAIRARSLSSGRERILEEKNPEVASSSAVFASGARAAASVSLALIPLAVSFGAAATGSGLSTLEALAVSVFVLSGGAQMAMIELISAGASVAIIALTVLIISLRLTLYSASLAPHFRRLSAGWKGLISYLLTDSAYAVSITRLDGDIKESNKRWYFLGAALAIWITWQASTLVGVLLGARVPEGLSLDFVLPLSFIALVVPAIKDRATSAAALSAGTAAVFAAALPLNIGLVAATLVGVLAGLLAEVATERGRKR